MKRACIIGWPVEHSRSPVIHKYWLQKYGIEGNYTKQAVSPEDLPAFIKNLAVHGFVGANVTIPHKEAVLELAEQTDPSAKAIGAANTLWIENNKLHASNTDAYGFMTYLNIEAPEWNELERPAVVLGAGGAARAIVHGLLSGGAKEIYLCNRTKSKAAELAKYFGDKVKAVNWEDRSTCLQEVGILVNTTKLGMECEEALDIDLHELPFTAVVADIVYVPLETDLILNAQSLGLKTIDGLGMLLHQAVPGFEKWFGVRPKVTDDLRDKLIEDLDL